MSALLAVHPAQPRFGVEIAKRDEARMGVVHVERRDDGRRYRLSYTGFRHLIQPVTGLDIVLRRRRRGATGCCRAIRRITKSLEEVVRGSIFLDHKDDVLKLCNLRLPWRRQNQR